MIECLLAFKIHMAMPDPPIHKLKLKQGKLFRIRQKIDRTHHCAVDPLLRRKVSVEIKATAAPLFSLGRTAINKHHQHLR